MGITNNATGYRPGVCTSTTRPTAPYTGQMVYETDTDYLMLWTGASWKYLLKGSSTSTNLPIENIAGAWTSYTPSWTAATTNPSLGNGSISGQYVQINKLVIAEFVIAMGSTTTYGSGDYRISLPVTSKAPLWAYQPCGYGRAYDSSAATTYNTTMLYLGGATSYVGIHADVTTSPLRAASLFTFAASDEITGQIIYQAA